MTAWTTPGSWTGSPSESYFNTHIRDNLNHLYENRAPHFHDLTETLISNSTTETTIYTYTIPGGTLSTGNAIKLRIPYKLSNTTGGNVTFTAKLLYGATTIATATTPNIASTNDGAGFVDAYLLANASASAQIGTIIVNETYQTATYERSVRGTATENSATDLALAIKITLGSASASYTWRKLLAEGYLLYP
jgi:hypothetical protein